MRNIQHRINASIYTLLITLSTPAFADDLDKLLEKAKQSTEEAQASLEKNQVDIDRKIAEGKAKLDKEVEEALNRNRKEIDQFKTKLDELEVETRKQWEQISKDSEKAYSELKAWSTQQYDKAEAEYKEWKVKHNFADKKEASPLTAEEKALAGKRAYTKINISEWATSEAASLDGLVQNIDAALAAESLSQDDITFVQDNEGNTLLHTLLKAAYQSERKYLEEFELRQIQNLNDTPAEAPAPDAYRSTELEVIAIAYLGDNTLLAGVANAQGQYPFDLIFNSKPRSMRLIMHVLAHDKDGLSAKRAQQLPK